MQLGYFTMPVHPAWRSIADTLREDRDAVVFAEALGFDEAFVGEHLTDGQETITSSLIFLASLVPVTSRIRLGAGTVNLTHHHPLMVAAHVAMLDHLSGGRIILGLSAGALPTDAEALGLLGEDRNRRFAESLDTLIACWAQAGSGALDIRLPDNRFVVTTRTTADPDTAIGGLYPTLQRPHPELVGTIAAPQSAGAVQMGAKGLHPLSAPFVHPNLLARHWDAYASGCQQANRVADRAHWRVARTVFVADREADVRRYAGTDGPYAHYFHTLARKLTRAGKAGVFDADGRPLTHAPVLDELLSTLVIRGTADAVAAQLLELQRVTGGFGRLMYAGIDWMEPELARRSMELMVTEVLPRMHRAGSA
jgi:alkanesulfonate monooxygenase SsuD/methylene tetrahydromethanopterin reductase-like flavin-dependent oxidoreductase (luciferase family)